MIDPSEFPDPIESLEKGHRWLSIVVASIVVVGLASGVETADAANRQVDEIRVAVASNFLPTARLLVADFEAAGHRDVVLISGSTGKHYAQIMHGAPFDVFLAADALRPLELERQGLAIEGSRFTYALGVLVLWSPRQDWIELGKDVLKSGHFDRLSIANPTLAPYGRAAQQTLEALGLWGALQQKLVRGENVGQAMHFVVSRSVDLGFVSASQVQTQNRSSSGRSWIVPQHFYEPIDQQAVLLVDSAPARSFLEYVAGNKARSIIRRSGYRVP